MAKGSKQLRMFVEQDSELAKACDALVDARDEKEKTAQGLSDAMDRVVQELDKARRVSVKHNGRTFTVRRSDPKVTVAITE